MAKEEIVTRIGADGTVGRSINLKDGKEEDLDVLPNEEDVIVKDEKKVAKKESDLDIEVVDDTPERDRGKKPLKKDATPPKEEIEKYNEEVQERINKLTHGYHDERRAKETASRERDEAVKLAKNLYQETQRLKKAGAEETSLKIKEMKEKASAQLDAAKRSYKEAYDANDPEKIAAAQEAISQATINREIAARTKEPDQVKDVSDEDLDKQVDAHVQRNQKQAEQQPVEDPRAAEWTKKNSKWFGEDRMMTSFALGVHQDLIEKGVHPVKDAEKYYGRINSLMREKFPEFEWGDETKPSVRRTEPKSATVVAPVQRTAKGTKVTLTTTQVALAKRLGLTPEQYARELVKSMEMN